MKDQQEKYITYANIMQHNTHMSAVKKGLWKKEPDLYQCMQLIKNELTEATEALESGNSEDCQCCGFSHVEVELADIKLMIASIAEHFSLNVIGAEVAKHNYNKSRPYMHGKVF